MCCFALRSHADTSAGACANGCRPGADAAHKACNEGQHSRRSSWRAGALLVGVHQLGDRQGHVSPALHVLV